MANILFFDSGYGALSIIAMANEQASLDCHLVSDNAFFPYGERDASELPARVLKVIQGALEADDYQAVVIACNTASTICLPAVRAALDIPVVGVVPAIKPAAQLSQSKVIGLLATPGTVSRDYTKQLVTDFASDCQVEMFGSSELVKIAEAKLAGIAINRERLQQLLEPVNNAIRDKNLDTLVLGCTHFPLIAQEITNALIKPVTLVDSGQAIIKQLTNLLAANEPIDSQQALQSKQKKQSKLIYTRAVAEQESQGIMQHFNFQKCCTMTIN
jgi:glutamate racemase